LVLAGCDPNIRYKTLSFFFDGVPSPYEDVLENEGSGKKRSAEGSGSKKGVYREHGPFAAKECAACHIRSSNQLVMPVEQLCFKCHVLNIVKKYVHGPLSSGGCRICHSPHGSGYDFLLVAEPKDFCFYCHNKSSILQKDVHLGAETQCTSCHDAHSSDVNYLLK
jgi:predicted CXXCH cytochrome family protein